MNRLLPCWVYWLSPRWWEPTCGIVVLEWIGPLMIPRPLLFATTHPQWWVIPLSWLVYPSTTKYYRLIFFLLLSLSLSPLRSSSGLIGPGNKPTAISIITTRTSSSATTTDFKRLCWFHYVFKRCWRGEGKKCQQNRDDAIKRIWLGGYWWCDNTAEWI